MFLKNLHTLIQLPLKNNLLFIFVYKISTTQQSILLLHKCPDSELMKA